MQELKTKQYYYKGYKINWDNISNTYQLDHGTSDEFMSLEDAKRHIDFSIDHIIEKMGWPKENKLLEEFKRKWQLRN